jgi:type VI secretion system protein ImpE
MNSEELAKSGKLSEAVSELYAEIRRNPADKKLRIFLFQLNCLLGQFEKALIQLQVIASLDSETMMMAQIFRPVIACEMLRLDIFNGQRAPLLFGEPAEWVGLLVQANSLIAAGHFDSAAELRERAFELAPANPGTLNGEPFDWLVDADSRMGPLLEVILEGKYYWVPFSRILKIEMEKPSDLRDLVWVPARFTWTNGGAVSGHIPARYPGTEGVNDDALRLARFTTWREVASGSFLGLGQRVMATNQGEYPLLECRSLEFLGPG